MPLALCGAPEQEVTLLANQTCDPMMGAWWARDADCGPTLCQHWDNVSCLLGQLTELQMMKNIYIIYTFH